MGSEVRETRVRDGQARVEVPSRERQAILTDGSRVGAWRTSRVEGVKVLVSLSVAALVAIGVSGCTSGIKLRNPQTGETATCGPYHVAPNMGFLLIRLTPPHTIPCRWWVEAGFRGREASGRRPSEYGAC